MYGPGESRQPMPPAGYGGTPTPGQGGGPPPGYGADPRQGQPGGGPGHGQHAGQGTPQPPQQPHQPTQHGQPGQPGQQHSQPYQPMRQGPPSPSSQQRAQQSARAAKSSSGVAGRLLVFAAAAVLVVTGGVNAVSGPLGYLNDVNVGVLVVGGNELFLALAQTVLGLAWLVAGVLLVTGRRFAWGLAIVSAGVFAVYESFFIVRGSVIHNVGLFLAIVVFVLLHQSTARMYCKVGPPAR